MGDWFKMGRVYTIMVPAKVIQIVPLRHGGNELLVNPTVCKNAFPCTVRSTTNPKHAISTSILICQPNPTSIWAILVNLSKETIKSILFVWQNAGLVLSHSPSSLTFIASLAQMYLQAKGLPSTLRTHSQAIHAHNITEFLRYVKVAY